MTLAQPPARARRTRTAIDLELDVLRAEVARLPLPPLPTATYRVQFHAGFGFRDATALVGYLHDLGISHLYASPYLRARSGSTHGYDVADPNTLNPELGSVEDYETLTRALRERDMGQLMDVVPNHMGIGDPGNYRWLDVLENGPSSIHGSFFDINWNPLKAESRDQNKLIVPILGDQYGRVLENGELSLCYDEGSFSVRYGEHRFPIAPDTYLRMLETCLEQMQDELGRRDGHVQELASILTALRHLPPRGTRDPLALDERNREKEIVKRRIRDLYATSPPFRSALEWTIQSFNGTRGERSSFDRLDELLGEQSYRLALWRVAAEEINYRRFFDIAELAAVRMEDPTVFRDTHRLLLRLVQDGKVEGLRIDHPDGLRDPAGYLRRLQRSCFTRYYAERLSRDEQAQQAGAESRDGPAGPGEAEAGAALEERLAHLFDRESRRRRAPSPYGFYIVVEKILSVDEQLPTSWPVHGTTGYDFLNVVNGLFVERANQRFVTNTYTRFIRDDLRYRELASSTKKMVMLTSLASEVNELGYELKRVAEADRRFRDFTLNGLTFAIREVIAALTVYRTYIDPETGAASEMDRRHVAAAVAEAKRRNPRTDPSIFEFVRDTLLLRYAAEADAQRRAEQIAFVARFQQTTGPVMAKGVEDTAFYVYNRLVSLNEVGGEPDRFGGSVSAFHRHNLSRVRQWPATLLATSTHDTKRSEDVRTRIDALSELPRDWRAALTRWSRLNGRKKRTVDGQQAPDRNEEYVLYQTLLGVWPFEPPRPNDRQTLVDRVAGAMLKSIKEAKVHTSWITPNVAYEEAVEAFVRVVLDEAESRPFLEDFQALQQRVATFGAFSSLSQTLLKLTSPGIPDVYQGNELWDFSLVDPDNRRPVDYGHRAELLASLRRSASTERGLRALAREVLEAWQDGRVKLWVTYRLLSLRRERPELFGQGAYVPLRAAGQKKRHVCTFVRAWESEQLVLVAPILVAGLTNGGAVPPVGADVWRDTTVQLRGEDANRYVDLFTGALHTPARVGGAKVLSLAEVLADFPVAALVGSR